MSNRTRASEIEEGFGEHVAAPSGEPGDGDTGVVVADAAWDTAEELEGSSMAVLEGFGALAGEGAAVEGIAERQGHDEEGDLAEAAADIRHGLAEVGLSLAGSVLERDEDLGLSSPPVKNREFIGSAEAGPRAAVLFTILAGAKRRRLEPWAYLRDVLLRLSVGEAELE